MRVISNQLTSFALCSTTAYPGQVGIHPIPLKWGASSAEARGPVVASRHVNSLKLRNASTFNLPPAPRTSHPSGLANPRSSSFTVGMHGGSYSVYKALAAAQGLLDPNHRPGKSSLSFESCTCGRVNRRQGVEDRVGSEWNVVLHEMCAILLPRTIPNVSLTNDDKPQQIANPTSSLLFCADYTNTEPPVDIKVR